MSLVAVQGKPFVFADGVERTLAPLSFRHLKVLMPRIVAFNGALDAAGLGLISDCVYASLSRNYPAMTQDEVDDLLNFSIAPAAFQTAMGVSDLVAKGGPSGEAVASLIGPS